MRSFFVALTRNPISLLGAAITTASAVLIATLTITESIGAHGSPYIGILAYLILPAIFVLGLVLIPIGVLRERKRARLAEARGEAPAGFPVLDFNVDRTRKIFLTFIVLTLVNLVIMAAATYKGVEVMDSTAFCGTTCHTVMHPEYTAYSRSPHARVKCVACHIGPGADWFVKAKLSGAWQVVSVALDLYPRPIPTPIHNLRPARETCEQCHWPTKFVGDRLKVITHYEEDEANTELKTVLVLRVGGTQGTLSHGIHWHVDPNIQVRYRADPSRQKVHEVELTLADGTVKNYSRGEAEEEEGESSWRQMDCVDCHNRPTHVYRTPQREIDTLLEQGQISRSVPYIRREGLAALQATYTSHADAARGIPEVLDLFYRREYPELSDELRRDVDQAGQALAEAYAMNVFPEMNVDWGTYPDFIGHEDFDGCFRCHDDALSTSDGEVISQDCFTCHSLLAMGEEQPEILEEIEP